MEWAKVDIIFGLPEDRTSSLLVLTTSATNKLLFIEYFWYFQGRQIGGLQRVKPNYAHPFASRASFFGAKPPSSEHPKKSHLLKKKCYYSHEIFKVNHLIGEFWCGGNFLLKKSHNSTANCKIVYLVVLLRKFCKPGSANVLCFLNIKKWKKK